MTRMLTLAELGSRGLFKDGDWVESKDQDPSGSVRLTQLADVGVGTFRDRSNRWMREDQARRLNCTRLEPQDVLIARMPDPIGRACIVPSNIGPAVTAVDVAILRLDATVAIPQYVMWMINAPQFNADVVARQSGTTRKRISRKVLAALSIPLPAMPEQRRIVEIVEDHLSRLDAAADYAAAASKRLSGLRDQLVRDAIIGRKMAGHRQESILADAGTNDGALPMLPSGWMWLRLEDVADVVGGITKDSKKQSDPAFVEVPYLRVANVQRGSLRLDDVTTIRVAPAKAEALRLRPGDVLLNEGGDRDKLARGWVWQGEIENCIHQNHVFRARIRDGLDPYFLSWTANTIGGRWAERNGKQSVNLASISLSMIRKMPVIVPPRDAASHIIQQLHEQLTSVDETSRQIEAAQVRGSALRRAVLGAAFTGRLTGSHTDQEVIEELADVPSSYSETMVTA
jgi:type I restriction enzyme S subunit